MQVILKKRVPKLGNEYDVVKVKPGYARNFLLPKKLAVLATTAEIKRAETMKATMQEYSMLIGTLVIEKQQLADLLDQLDPDRKYRPEQIRVR